MDNDGIRAGIAAYQSEIANIRFFLREKRTIQEWQDWLWRKVSKFTAKTTKFGPSTMLLGQGWKDISCRYTDLLTLLCKIGEVERVRTAHMTTYRWVGVDKK